MKYYINVQRSDVPQRDTVDEEDIHQYIKDQYNYYTFDYKLEYKKLQRKLVDGPLSSASGIPLYFLRSKTRLRFPMATNTNTHYKRGFRYATNKNLDLFLKLMEEAKENMKEYIDEVDPSVAVVQYVVDCEKMFDSQNGHRLKIMMEVTQLKDETAVARGTRQLIKNVINEAFRQDYMKWTHHNNGTYGKLSNVLPTDLLQNLLMDKISWRVFCDRLLAAREPKSEEEA